MKRNRFVSAGLSLLATTLLVSVASAEVQNGSGQDLIGSGALAQGLMLAAFAFIFYFLILRPQNKRARQHRELVTGLQKGDEVITTGGLLGKIHRIADNFLVIMLADGIEVVIQRQAVVGSVPKGTLKNI